MDLKQLRFFVSTVDAGSISYASRLLHITQPALSRQITNLEFDLKVDLLHRTFSGVVPTEHGLKLYEMAKKLLQDFNQIAETMAEVKDGAVSRVALGCMNSVANYFAEPLISTLSASHPNLSLTFYADQVTNLYQKLANNFLDIGIVCSNPEIEGLETQFILREELMLAVAGKLLPHSSAPEVPLEQLQKLPFVFSPIPYFSTQDSLEDKLSRMSVKSVVENVLKGPDIKPRISLEIDSVSIIKRLVADGIYCTISPWSAVYEEVERGDILLKRIEGHKMFRDIFLCWPQFRPMTNATSTLHQVLTETVKDLIDSGTWRHASLDA